MSISSVIPNDDRGAFVQKLDIAPTARGLPWLEVSMTGGPPLLEDLRDLGRRDRSVIYRPDGDMVIA